MKIIIIGGGFAGCQAAIQARRMGAEVHIIERTDMLLGVGNVRRHNREIMVDSLQQKNYHY